MRNTIKKKITKGILLFLFGLFSVGVQGQQPELGGYSGSWLEQVYINGGWLNEVVIVNNYVAPKPQPYVATVYTPTNWTNYIDYGGFFNSGGGGGGSNGISYSSPPSPCLITSCPPLYKIQLCSCVLSNCAQLNSMASLTSSLDGKTLNNNISVLKAAIDNKVNVEKGFSVGRKLNSDESFTYLFNDLPNGTGDKLPLFTDGYEIGAFHTHPPGTIPIFSYTDLKFLVDVYDSASQTRKEEAFVGIVSKDVYGNTVVYALKIENIDYLKSRVNTIWEDKKYAALNNVDRSTAIDDDQRIIFEKNKGDLVKAFLDLYVNSGLALYKAIDGNVSNFGRLKIEYGGILTTTLCNN